VGRDAAAATVAGGMNRRGFLATLLAGAAGFALDPERLLWVPGQKTIFLPPVIQSVVFDPPVGYTMVVDLEDITLMRDHCRALGPGLVRWVDAVGQPVEIAGVWTP